jgi:hypothetical protein
VDLFQSSQWDSTSLFFLLISSRGNASLLTISTASWRAQNSLLHARKVVEVAHIDMTAWFIYNLVLVLVLSKRLATVGLLRITCCIELQPRPPPVQVEMHSIGIQLRPAPWPSFYCYAALVQWITSLVVADDILPKPPWLAFDPGTLFKVDCSCSNTRASLQIYSMHCNFHLMVGIFRANAI